jgi:hypothetical protein
MLDEKHEKYKMLDEKHEKIASPKTEVKPHLLMGP